MEDPSIPPRLSSRVRWVVPGVLVCAAALLALVPGCSRSSRGGSVARVRINEVMAANSAFPVADGAGRIVHVDWVEIHNPGSTAVSLEGYTLSDDPGNRDKFEFPRGTLLEPDGYLLVFLMNSENCRIDCKEAVRICRAEAADDDACETELVECERDCSPPAGLVADFNLSALGETLFLYADSGRTLIDRAGVRAQANNISNGLDPRTGEYGVMYVPTPRARNMPINLKGSFIDPMLVRAECDSEVLLRFKVRRDLDAPGDLEVRLEHTIVEDCKESLVGRPLESGPVTRVVPAGGDPETFDLSRKDPSGSPIVVEVVELLYHAVLPAAPCGERRKYRFTVSDALGSSSRTACVTHGASFPTVVVNEYQPGNERFFFEFVNSSSVLVQPDPPPDWIEIYNYGDRPVDISGLALVTGGNLRDQVCDSWLFGRDGNVTESLPPGGFLWVLADQDGGTRRRSYFRLPDGSGPYFSTRFALQADRKGAPFDEFSIVDPSTCEVIDRVVLDFSAHGFELERGRSVVRFPGVEGTEPGALMPGTITDCPTPAGKNQITCVVPPQFEEEVTITTPSRSHCPAAGEPVTIHARVNFDSDTPLHKLEVVASVSVEAPPATFSRSPQQGGSAIVTTLYDISLEVPGQPAGTLVTFAFSARDLTLTGDAGNPVVHDATAIVGQRTAFQYLVGYERPPGAPRLNEVLPRNRSITLPPFEGGAVKYHDFAEIYNPSTEPLDLGGYYLTTEIRAADPIGLRRRWRFPEASGTIVPPGGFLPVYFGPPPASLPVDPPPEEQDPPYIQVKGFKLDSCEETLHLVAPDDPALGGNCVVDSLHWNLNLIQCASNRAVGRLCDGCDSENCILELPVPTPGASNKFRPVIFHDSFHQAVIPAGDRNACVGANATVKV
ncbi:MAG TPA: lamin tail domain-containing protein, partial [Planctomycetota bacterium]|nr:lamin tail domain-containing protein [Planctomycetota bacterium]